MVGGNGVDAYIVSVDPIGDTPQRARGVAEPARVPGGAGQYLIGTRDELRPVWIHYGIAPLQALAPGGAGGRGRRRRVLPRQPGVQPAADAAVRLPGRPPQPTTTPPRRRRRLPGPRRPRLPRPRPAHRGLGLRALGLRAADRQARDAAARHPVRVARAGVAGARHPDAPRRALAGPTDTAAVHSSAGPPVGEVSRFRQGNRDTADSPRLINSATAHPGPSAPARLCRPWVVACSPPRPGRSTGASRCPRGASAPRRG